MSLPKARLNTLKHDLLQYMQGGQKRKADKLYRQNRKRDIPDPELWRMFAAIQYNRQDYKELAYCCQQILKLVPDDVTARYNLGASLQNLGKPSEAITQYEICIEKCPSNENAFINCARLYLETGHPEKAEVLLNILLETKDSGEILLLSGEVRSACGKYAEALGQFRHVLANEPNHKKALFLSAKCLYEAGDYTDSETLYRQFLALEPDNLSAINNLGRVYEEKGELEKAIEQYLKATTINDRAAIIYLNLGKAYTKKGDFDEAERAFQQATDLEPEHPEAFFCLGKLYSEILELNKAEDYLQKALSKNIKKYIVKADEFRLAVKYFLAAIHNEEQINSDQKAFIADLFNGYAERFEEHLVNDLQYITPEIINDLIQQYLHSSANVAIDLGCGTGLCCKYLRGVSKYLIGVDISEKMVQKASQLNCYDELITGEMSDVMNDLEYRFDLVVAADVFVYVGSLRTIFACCKRKMNRNGLLIFEIEELYSDIKDDYRLCENGRYKHSIHYINCLANEHGFKIIQHKKVPIRKEQNRPVPGYVSVLEYTG